VTIEVMVDCQREARFSFSFFEFAIARHRGKVSKFLHFYFHLGSPALPLYGQIPGMHLRLDDPKTDNERAIHFEISFNVQFDQEHIRQPRQVAYFGS
jgi:hypothetical protein